MKWAFLMSGLIELIGGILCYLNPELLEAGGSAFIMRLYGLGAMTLGLINLILFFFYTETKLTKFIFLAMMFFHGAIAMMIHGARSSVIQFQLEATLTHLSLFLIFLITYLKDLKPDKNNFE